MMAALTAIVTQLNLAQGYAIATLQNASGYDVFLFAPNFQQTTVETFDQLQFGSVVTCEVAEVLSGVHKGKLRGIEIRIRRL